MSRPMSDSALLGLVRIIVAARAKYACEYPACGAICFLENHHAESRRHLAVKFDPDCCVELCSKHHALAEKNRKALVRKLIATGIRPEAWAEYLADKKRELVTDKDELKKRMEFKCRGLLSELGIKI